MNQVTDGFSPPRSSLKKQERWAWLVLLAGCLLLLMWRLDAYSLINVTEARQAEIARQMLVRQDWVTPMYNGDPYFDKPVLLHWCIALGFAIFGVQDWVARLPSAVAAIALILSTWSFIARVANPRQAWLTAVMLTANPFTWALGRIGYHDMLLVLFLTVALYSWYWAHHCAPTAHLARQGYLVYFGCLALAVLAKGPLAVVLGGLILGLYGLWTQNWRSLRSMPWGWGITLFLAIAGPWYGLVLQANGWAYIRGFFGASNVSRFVSANQNQWGPWYYYLVGLVLLFFPWIVLLPRTLGASLLQSTRTRKGRVPVHQSPLLTFMLIWFLTVLVFMSLAATKLSWYLYPGIPALAYLCAESWDRRIRSPDWGVQAELIVVAGGYGGLAIALSQNWLEAGLMTSLSMAGLRWFWIGGLALAAILVLLVAMLRQVGWAAWIGAITFGMIAMGAAHSWMPVLDRQVLDQQLIPIAQTLRQLTCDTCTGNLTGALDLRFPSLNVYSSLTRIERFAHTCDIPAALTPQKQLLLVATDDTLADESWTPAPRYLVQKSGRFNLLAIPAGDPILLQFQQTPCPS